MLDIKPGDWKDREGGMQPHTLGSNTHTHILQAEGQKLQQY